jgi:hypothetical protein
MDYKGIVESRGASESTKDACEKGAHRHSRSPSCGRKRRSVLLFVEIVLSFDSQDKQGWTMHIEGINNGKSVNPDMPCQWRPDQLDISCDFELGLKHWSSG